MKSIIPSLLLLLSPLTVSAETIALFNGKDLSGWTLDTPERDKANATGKVIPPSFTVRDGLLVSMGKPLGHLVTEQEFSNYTLVVEYRFSKDPGNCGVLVHASTPRYLYDMFPKSIEVQMMHQNAGDFWCIGENIEVPNMEQRRPRKENQAYGGEVKDARRIIRHTHEVEKPLGEWNTMEIVCKGNEITVSVNGKLVNHGTKSTASTGKIALQAEGAEVEFRKVELTKLPK
jgi:hypothetical protein